MSDFYSDLHMALSGIDNPLADGDANYGKYATLSQCLKNAKAALSENNFVIVQMVQPEPDRLVTRLVHTSGEMLEDGGVPLRCVDQNNPQKMGAAITYARRYGLCALLGIVGDADDDAQSATAPEALPKPKLARKPRVIPDAMVPIDVVPPPPEPDEIESEQTDRAWTDDFKKLIERSKDMKELMDVFTTAHPVLKRLKEQRPEFFASAKSCLEKTSRILENKGVPTHG